VEETIVYIPPPTTPPPKDNSIDNKGLPDRRNAVKPVMFPIAPMARSNLEREFR
jgi:hypothetical protein